MALYRSILLIVNGILMLVGLAGNTLVLLVSHDKHRRNPTAVLISALATADTLVILTFGSLYFANAFTPGWKTSTTVCQVSQCFGLKVVNLVPNESMQLKMY